MEFDSESLFIRPDDKLFGSSGHWHTVAMTLGSTSRSVPYTQGFKEAADALVKVALDEHVQDMLLFPILYCYRHSVELVLKDLIYLEQRERGGPYEAIRHHKLPALWRAARAVIERAGEPDREQLDAIGALVSELAEVDLDGEQFRYDRDRTGHSRPLPTTLERVDLLHVSRMVEKLFGQLFGAVLAIEEMLEEMPREGP